MDVTVPKIEKRELEDGTVVLDYERHGVEIDFERRMRHAAAASAGAPVWNGDLSTGDWSQWGGVEYAGTFTGTPPKSDRLKVGGSIDGRTPVGVTSIGEVIVFPGDRYGGSSGERTLLRQHEPIQLLPAGYDSYFAFAIAVGAAFPDGVNLWDSGWEMHQTKAPYVTVTGPAPYGFRCFGPAEGFEINLAGGRDGARVVAVDHARVAKGFDPAKMQGFVFRYHHDPHHGDYELYYAQQGGTIKQVISAPDVGTTYEETLSYPLFGLYRAPAAVVSKMWVEGAREYASRADALAWLATLTGAAAPPPPPPVQPDPTTAVSSVVDGAHLVGLSSWTVAVTGPGTEVEFYAGGASIGRSPVANGVATYTLDPAKMTNVTGGGFWVYDGTRVAYRSPTIAFTLTAAPTAVRDLKSVGMSVSRDGLSYYLAGVKIDGSKVSGTYHDRAVALAVLDKFQDRLR